MVETAKRWVFVPQLVPVWLRPPTLRGVDLVSQMRVRDWLPVPHHQWEVCNASRSIDAVDISISLRGTLIILLGLHDTG